MTKQEVIKKSWGQLFEKHKNRISLDDGYIHFKSDKFLKKCQSLFEVDFHPHYVSIFRPKSLEGIENNNGWIKIESEEDLPEKDFYKGYITFPIDFKCNSVGLHKYFKSKEITHYQPIEKPKPPIY